MIWRHEATWWIKNNERKTSIIEETFPFTFFCRRVYKKKIKQGNKVERRKKMRKSVNISWSHVKENYVKSWFTSMERIYPLIGLYPHHHTLEALIFPPLPSFIQFSIVLNFWIRRASHHGNKFTQIPYLLSFLIIT